MLALAEQAPAAALAPFGYYFADSVWTLLQRLAGGDGRDRIYSWPLTNPCRVDQETGRQAYAADGWADAALVNVLGLDALEHLLFAGPDNVCPGQVDINEDGLWDALGEEGVRQARAEYAVVLTGALVADLEAQQAAWEAFGPKLAAAGDGSPYETQIDGLNAAVSTYSGAVAASPPPPPPPPAASAAATHVFVQPDRTLSAEWGWRDFIGVRELRRTSAP